MLRLSTRAAAIAAMVVVSSLGTVAMTTGVASASATTPAVSCTKFSATVKGTATVSGCTQAADTGGSAKETAVLKGSGGTGTITWATSHGKTITKFTYSSVKPNKCTAGASEIKEVATVQAGGTGKASNIIKKGQVGTLLLCVKGSTITLLPGQKFAI
jgi:hypothetical protein